MMETFVAAMTSIKRFFEKREVDGQAAAEYALILVLVAIAIIVGVTLLGRNVNNTLNKVANAVSTGS